MNREEMLEKLHNLHFCLFWPERDEVIGFTEKQIWVNHEGWGSLSCDEPNVFYEADAIPDEKWKKIKEKLVNKTLTVQDIKGTSLEEMYFFEVEYFSCDNLKGLLNLPDTLESSFFVADDWDYPKFYLTKDELVKSQERSNVYDKWENFSDDELKWWIDLIFIDGVQRDFNS